MPGVFDTIASPAERQEKIIRKALELRRSQWSHDGYLYQGAADLLLRHGKFYSGRRLPDQYVPLLGAESACFQNAMEACEADSSLRYVEGVYTTSHGHYTPHAWCIDPAGQLLEVTVPTDPETLAVLIHSHTKLPYLGIEHWGYWGAEFDAGFVTAYCEKYQPNNVGILDRPAQDAAEGLPEWRDEWPILRDPYDPTRTEP